MIKKITPQNNSSEYTKYKGCIYLQTTNIIEYLQYHAIEFNKSGLNAEIPSAA